MKRSLAALLLPLLAACTFTVDEASLLHPTPGGGLPAGALARAAPAYAMTEHNIAAPDGARLSAVLLRQPGARATILYFGGNGFTIERYGAWVASVFAPLGVDLMIVDHRGYGRSEGVPTQANLEADGVAAFDYLARLTGDPARILVHGQSLGSFIAGRVAAERPTGGRRAGKLGDDHRGMGRGQSARRGAPRRACRDRSGAAAAEAIFPTWRRSRSRF